MSSDGGMFARNRGAVDVGRAMKLCLAGQKAQLHPTCSTKCTSKYARIFPTARQLPAKQQ